LVSNVQAHFALQNRDARSRRAYSAWSLCDLYGSAVNLPGHPCGSLKKDNNVCPDRNVPQGHNHGHASRHYPSPLGLNLQSSKALVRPALRVTIINYGM
jgi:hypothetical protein